MLKTVCAACLFAASLSATSVPASAGGWSGGERDLIFASFKRGTTLERVWTRLGSRR